MLIFILKNFFLNSMAYYKNPTDNLVSSTFYDRKIIL